MQPLPQIGHPWPTPEQAAGTYAGLIHTPEGLHHLVLLDALPDQPKLAWSAGMAWAASIGGDLPSRVESLVLFKHLPDKFAPYWYWTNEQYSDASYAWGQYFLSGTQGYGGKSYEGRVRAVRRFPIDPSILQLAPPRTATTGDVRDRAEAKASPRRFTGQPITGFGALA